MARSFNMPTKKTEKIATAKAGAAKAMPSAKAIAPVKALLPVPASATATPKAKAKGPATATVRTLATVMAPATAPTKAKAAATATTSATATANANVTAKANDIRDLNSFVLWARQIETIDTPISAIANPRRQPAIPAFNPNTASAGPTWPDTAHMIKTVTIG
jgi:hypothetical protein